jgi:glycogen debranching enzyme
MADLFQRAGEDKRAARLRTEAEALRARFNQDFWVKEKGFYALALAAGKKQAAVLSSNPGHLLWSGIADPEKARRMVEKLMADDMFNGFGIRTLSAKERRYNPISYHLGSVWPHDNALIAAGFRRYGFDEAACRIFTGILDAAIHFEDHRLPELFSGFQREEYGVPVCYPVACHPQAWAAAAVPYLITTGLGLVPEGFDHRLRIVRPILPAFIEAMEVHHLKVGQAKVDLKFVRASDKKISVEVLKVDGPLEVVVETGSAASEEGWRARSFRF